MVADKMNIRFRIKAVDDFSRTFDRLERKLDQVGVQAKAVDALDPDVDIKGDDSHFDRVADRVERRKWTLKNNPVTVKIKAEYQHFRRILDRVADFSRDVGEVIQNTLVSSIGLLAPIASQAIGLMAGAIGNLGPVVGTLGGGILGLGTSFAAAGAGAVAYGGMASFALQKVVNSAGDLYTARQMAENADNPEDRAKWLQTIKDIQDSLTAAELRGADALAKTRGQWEQLALKMQPGIIDAFVLAMDSVRIILTKTEPMFRKVTDVVSKLAQQLKDNLASDDVLEFFAFLNTYAAPALDTMAQAFGNLLMGVLNVFQAFAPLSVDMQNGFLNMTERFREWTASLEESKRFQAFVDYVRENLPKLGEIFGNIFYGIIELFASFGDSSQGMIDKLVEMTDSFLEWARTLDENKQFQDFINYINENGPKFLEFMGKLWRFLQNIGEGFASAAETITPLLNNFLDFANGLMENHPWMMKWVALIVSFAGAFGLVALPVRLAWRAIVNLFTPLKMLWSWIGAKILPIFTRLYLYFVTNVLPILSRVGSFIMTRVVPALGRFWGAISKVLPWIMRIGRFIGLFFMSPIGLLVAAVIGLAALIIWKWDEIKQWTYDMAVKVGKWFAEMYVKVKEKVTSMVTSAVNKFIELKNKATEKIAELIAKGIAKFLELKRKVTEKIESLKTAAIEKFNRMKEDAKKKFAEMLKAATDKFQEMKDKIDEKLESAKEAVGNILDAILGIFDGFSLYESGKAIIQSAIDGITDMTSSITGAVSDVAGAVRRFWPFSPAKEGPLSDIHKMDFAGPIKKSIKKAERPINAELDRMIKEPEFSMSGRQKVYQSEQRHLMYDGRQDETNALLREMREELARQREIIIELDKREVGRAVEPEVSEIQKRNKGRDNKFTGGRTR